MQNSTWKPLELRAFSVDQAAKALGLCKNSLYPYIHNGQLPSYRIGRRRLIRRDALEKFQERLEAEHTDALRGS